MAEIGVDGSEYMKEYCHSKAEYLSMLRRWRLEKGRLRTFIGLSSWIYAHDATGGAIDLVKLHIEGFSHALEQASRMRSSSDIRDGIERLRPRWDTRGQSVEARISGRWLVEPPIDDPAPANVEGPTVISLFSGAMGLDLGYRAAGFDVRVANDIDPWSHDTARLNLPDLAFIARDIDTVSTKELLDMASLKAGDVDVLLGGPPCQPFSPAGKRMGLSDPRASPLRYFIRAVDEIRPRAFVMEEVPGILSSRLKNFPIAERGARRPTADEERGSAWRVILQMLQSTGYKMAYGILNAADFGAPQSRERVIFIGLREGIPTLPSKTHSGLGVPGARPWNSFWEATADLDPREGDYMQLTGQPANFMRHVPPGGNWRALPAGMVRDAMGGALESGGGKMGFYRRLAWDEPSPTVVTTPSQKGTMLVHPEYCRFLSVQEYARLQGFPDSWRIGGSLADQYRLIGNAVPVHLSYAIARHTKKLLEGRAQSPDGGVFHFE